MSQQRYTPEFKDEAVRQVTEKGHSVQDVAARLGVSSHSLYKWVKAVKPEKDEQRADELLDAKKEILKLRAELRRVQEERDILKNYVGASVHHLWWQKLQSLSYRSTGGATAGLLVAMTP
jgi:transposase